LDMNQYLVTDPTIKTKTTTTTTVSTTFTTTITSTTVPQTTTPLDKPGEKCIEYDVEYTGRNYIEKYMKTHKRCKKLCSKFKACKTWTWYPDQKNIPRANRGVCILRRNFRGEKRLRGAIAGYPKNCG